MSDPGRESLVAFGEALWDCLPNGLFVGGAPLNVAYHAAQLGVDGIPATSVGRDFLGDQIVARAEWAKLDLRLLKRHAFLTTGVSIVELDDSGSASYDIREPVAWDAIEVDDDGMAVVNGAGAFVYGTLAARSAANRATLDRLLASEARLKICDVNLRPPHDQRERAIELASKADIVKLNEDELFVLAGVDGEKNDLEEGLRAAQAEIGVKTLCVTLGGDGALLWEDGEITREQSGSIKVADTIGAGDSFTAALAVFAMRGHPLQECLRRAVALGAFVASQHGAQPRYEPAEVFGDG